MHQMPQPEYDVLAAIAADGVDIDAEGRPVSPLPVGTVRRLRDHGLIRTINPTNAPNRPALALTALGGLTFEGSEGHEDAAARRSRFIVNLATFAAGSMFTGLLSAAAHLLWG
mgnify:CR=1 FL=1